MDKTWVYCPACAGPLGPVPEDEGQRCADCGRQYYDNPVPVAAALVDHPDGIILIRNKGWPEGMLGLVTGFVDHGETPAKASLREVSEELDLTGRIETQIGVYPLPQMGQLLFAYWIRAEGSITLSDELEQAKPVDPARLRGWDFGTGLAVRDWLIQTGHSTTA